jgi:hypothetical protein
VLHKFIDQYGFTHSNQPAIQFGFEGAWPATLADQALLSVTCSVAYVFYCTEFF